MCGTPLPAKRAEKATRTVRFPVCPRRCVCHHATGTLMYEHRADSQRRSAATAIRLLIREFSLGVLLYKRYRSGIIHDYGVDLDERSFFKKASVYWRTMYKLYVPPMKFLQVEFPARLLSKILANCVEGYA